MTGLARGQWTTPDCPVSVDYSLSVVEQIRILATDGFHRLSRGGIEVGGVLFGAHAKGVVRIDAMRQVSCTYSRGPSYLLSQADRLQFQRTVESHRTDPGLDGLIPVGWFVSHTRSDLALTEFDLEVFKEYFPEDWQVALILRPDRTGATRAGFFPRPAEGAAPGTASPLEFQLDVFHHADAAPVSNPVAIERPPAARRPRARIETADPVDRPVGDGASLSRREAQLPVVTEPPLPRFLLVDTKPAKSRKWRWLFIYAAIVATIVIGIRVYLVSRDIEPLSLQAVEEDGEMHVRWNRAASAMSGAQRGLLEITDEGAVRSVKLSPAQLEAGIYRFLRKGSDVNVKLTLYDSSGAATEEVTRFLGQPVAKQKIPESREPDQEALRLTEENSQLKDDLREERARLQQLEKRAATLENLLRIERDRTQLLRPRPANSQPAPPQNGPQSQNTPPNQ